MEPRLLKTDIAEYTAGVFDGVNRSGIQPIGEKVLVLTDQVKEKTAGGIFITDDARERNALAAETGVIVDVGEGAFVWNDDKSRPWGGYKPKAGDAVYIVRYAGIVFTGDDGQKYRIIDYGQIGAIRAAPLSKKEG